MMVNGVSKKNPQLKIHLFRYTPKFKDPRQSTNGAKGGVCENTFLPFSIVQRQSCAVATHLDHRARCRTFQHKPN
uniref:Uncharacterized protein n=1 Tax=Anopheles albimanus TaxID=7167 RepID=A0A182FWH9_ANOAL